MTAFHVEFTKSAKKEFDQIPARIQNKVLEGLALLEINPFSDLLQIKKIKGVESLYRFRVGDYRVVFEVRKKVLLVLIIKIGHRKEIYR
jgi:mRNA interferase RelE/StbE